MISRGRPLRRPSAVIALAVLFACTGLVAGARVADAHAALVRSSPSSQAQLSGPPSSIDLWFSEPLEPAFSTFEVLAADGRALPIAGIRVDPADPFHLSGLPERLPPGLYTVAYRSLSTQDGHEWTGTFPFTVLNPDGSVPTGEAFAPELGGRTSLERITGRWLGFAGWSLVLGALLIQRIAARSRRSEATVRNAAHRVADGLALAALPLLVIGGALELAAQADALETSVVSVLSGTRFGTLWLWRQLAVLALATSVALGIFAAARRRPRILLATRAVSVAAAIGGLSTVSLISHAAAAPGFAWAVLVDATHLIVAAGWIGGLATLAALLLRLRHQGAGKQAGSVRTGVVLGVVGPFSIVAATAVFVLSVTGILRGLGELPTLGALVGTAYGGWLLIKLALVVPLLGVAWLNRRTLERAVRGGRQTEIAATNRLTRMLPLEALLGFAVLAAVAVLGQVPTARGTDAGQSAAPAPAFTDIRTADDLSMHLQVSPASVGMNELRVHVYPIAGGTAERVQGVFFTFAAAGRLGGERIEATPAGGGIYAAAGDFLSLADTWDVRVDVRRPQGDVTASFAVPISPKAGADVRGAWSSPAPQLSLITFAGLLSVAGGAAAILAAQRMRQRSQGGVVGLGGLVVFLGLWAAASGGTTGGVSGANPIPVSEESIRLGSTLYAANCASCHGTTGRGDGPLAAALRPPPADLQAHVPLHPERDTFTFVSEGFPGSAMPAWKEQLTEEEIWHLVNFLREGMPR